MDIDQRISESFQRQGFSSAPIGMTTEVKQLISDAIDYCTPELPDKRYGQITARLVNDIESKKQELGL